MISNINVNQAIIALNKKVVELRTKDLKHPLRPKIKKFYNYVIIPWSNRDINGEELSSSYNEEVMDQILEWINLINKSSSK